MVELPLSAGLASIGIVPGERKAQFLLEKRLNGSANQPAAVFLGSASLFFSFLDGVLDSDGFGSMKGAKGQDSL
jgi:hypothetical protein